jgi:hypothetical protein
MTVQGKNSMHIDLGTVKRDTRSGFNLREGCSVLSNGVVYHMQCRWLDRV